MEGIGIIVLLIILLLVLWSGRSGENLEGTTRDQRDAWLIADITSVYQNRGKYQDYMVIGRSTLSPWQFERLMGLARKGLLNAPNIDIVMGL